MAGDGEKPEASAAAAAAAAEAAGEESQDLLKQTQQEQQPQVELPQASFKGEMKDSFYQVKELFVASEDPLEEYRGKSWVGKAKALIFWVFPILDWLSTYQLSYLPGDIIGGLTIASLAVPQDLGYAGLAKVPPINGLYSSFTPPLVYSVLGTSRDIAIGPTAVVCLLMGSLLSPYIDPSTYPTEYLQLAFTVTFFSGIIQLAMGVFQLGFLVDYLSHAAVVGFMGGAAITIGLQQLKGLLGYTKFTNETDIVNVLSYIFSNTYLFNWRAFLIGISFLLFFLVVKVLGWYYKKHKPLGKIFFFLGALGPLLSVVIATLSVWATQSNTLVPCVQKMPSGVSNLSSVNQLLLSGEWTLTALALGAVVGLISLTEAIAIARTFAAMKGYHVDGNKEMVAYGCMNLASSLTSGIACTGSFSRSAVNFNSGCNTMLTNIIMAIVVLIVLLCLTQVFVYLPQAVLSAIIIAAVVTLCDIPTMIRIWKVDKMDFLVMLGTFLGVIFDSVEIGLLVGVAISMLKILVLVTRPHVAILGELPDAPGVYRNVEQYKGAKTSDGILVLNFDAPLFFTNGNFIRERILYLASKYPKEHNAKPLTHIVFDFSKVSDVDTSGIHSLHELHKQLHKAFQVEVGISNPSRIVLRKLDAAGFVKELGRENLFYNAHEAVKIFTRAQMEGPSKSLPDAKELTAVDSEV